MAREQTTSPEKQHDQEPAAQADKAETASAEEQHHVAPDARAGEARASSPGVPAGNARSTSFPTEEVIGWILRVGVIGSAILIAAGVLLLFITGSTGYPGSLSDLAGLVGYGNNRANLFPTTPGAVFVGAALLKPYALIALGLVLLIATPVLRVAASVVIFLLERDYAYVLITLFVLLVLLVSFLLGKAG